MKSQHKASSKTVSKSNTTPNGKSAKSGKPSAQLAKKSAPVKKKSAPVPPKKAALIPSGKKSVPAKAPMKSVSVAKKAAPAPAAKKAGAKPDLKDLKKKPMEAPAAKQAAQHAAASSNRSATAAKDEKKKTGVAGAAPIVTTAPKKATEKSADKAPEKSSDKSGDKQEKATAKPSDGGKAPKAAAMPHTEAKEAKSAAVPIDAAEKPSTLTGKAEKASARKAKDDGMTIEEPKAEGEIVLTDAEGRRYCRVKDCDQIALVDSYCRYHYLLFWKNIQVRKKILSEGKLERYIEELTARYPDKYLDMLRKDLRNEKDFQAAIQELEIDEASVDNEYEDEAQSYLEEVRGMSSEVGATREEEDF